mmetsp:Transcript_5568/g.9670  ORF Transcript_5568/g.9670 Transcript_5568/m.9670 type:complete len:82 (+) Transcript_5568:88-333(+)
MSSTQGQHEKVKFQRKPFQWRQFSHKIDAAWYEQELRHIPGQEVILADGSKALSYQPRMIQLHSTPQQKDILPKDAVPADD